MHIPFCIKQKTSKREKEEGRGKRNRWKANVDFMLYLTVHERVIFTKSTHREENLEAKIFFTPNHDLHRSTNRTIKICRSKQTMIDRFLSINFYEEQMLEIDSMNPKKSSRTCSISSKNKCQWKSNDIIQFSMLMISFKGRIALPISRWITKKNMTNRLHFHLLSTTMIRLTSLPWKSISTSIKNKKQFLTRLMLIMMRSWKREREKIHQSIMLWTVSSNQSSKNRTQSVTKHTKDQERTRNRRRNKSIFSFFPSFCSVILLK